MAKSRDTSRAKVIRGLREELHLHKHSNGWYLIIFRWGSMYETAKCNTDECIHVKRKRGDKIDQL